MALSFSMAAKIFKSGKKIMTGGATVKTASIFKRAKSFARHAFDSSTINKDPVMRFSRALGEGARSLGDQAMSGKKTLSGGVRKAWDKVPNPVSKVIKGSGRAIRKAAPVGLLTVGAVGMLSVGIMKGAYNASQDIVYERYMQDQRFARNILQQSRIGNSIGTRQLNSMGSTIGLSNALSKTRHGASY